MTCRQKAHLLGLLQKAAGDFSSAAEDMFYSMSRSDNTAYQDAQRRADETRQDYKVLHQKLESHQVEHGC